MMNYYGKEFSPHVPSGKGFSDFFLSVGNKGVSVMILLDSSELSIC